MFNQSVVLTGTFVNGETLRQASATQGIMVSRYWLFIGYFSISLEKSIVLPPWGDYINLR
jgi:hypothetical protein